MNIDGILVQLVAKLADGLHEGQAFNIADRAADFDQDEILVLKIGRGEFLDLVGDMGNNLYRSPQIVTAAFFANNTLINAPRGDVVTLL